MFSRLAELSQNSTVSATVFTSSIFVFHNNHNRSKIFTHPPLLSFATSITVGFNLFSRSLMPSEAEFICPLSQLHSKSPVLAVWPPTIVPVPSFNLAKNRIVVWPVHLNRPCSFREPESTVALVTGKAMFLNQAAINQSSTGQTKDIRKQTLIFPPEMWFNFANECGARPPVVNRFLFFPIWFFNNPFSAAAPFHVTIYLVPPPGDRVRWWVRFSPEDPTTEDPERWSYLRMPRFQLCRRDHGLHQTQRAPRSARSRTLLLD